MRYSALAAALLLAGPVCILAQDVDARMHAGPPVLSAHHRLKAVGGAIDGFGAPASAAYSFRLLRSAYLGTGAAVRLRRASDNAESDIGFSGSGDFDTASATTFCAATSCFVAKWYDQSGNARDLTQGTAASQLGFLFNCDGALPCARASAATTQTASSAGSFAAASPVSLSAVSRRPSGTGANCLWIQQSSGTGNRLATAAADWYLAAAAAFFAVPRPADNVWHSQQGVINGASSVLGVDGTDTTGTVTVAVAAGVITIGTAGAAGLVCDFAEAVMWIGYALTPAERAALTANQRAYWGF